MTFFNKLLGFSQQISIIKTIKEDTLNYFFEAFELLSHSDLMKLKKYILMYAKNAEVQEENRGEFFIIVEKIEKSIIQNTQNSDNKSTTSMHDSVFSEVTENLINGFTINEFVAKEELKKEPNVQKNGIEFRKTDVSSFDKINDLNELFSVSSAEAEKDEKTLNSCNNKCRTEKFSDESNQDGLEESLLVSDDEDSMKQKIQKGDFLKKDVLMDNEEDDYVDPLEGLSSKELRKRLPAYIFMSNKRKKKYFKTLSKNYTEKIMTRKIQKKNDNRVNFVLENNTVSRFFKMEKLQ